MQEHEPLQPLSDSQMERNEEAVSSYQAALTVDAARWLLDRGIGKEAADTFRLGVVANPLPEHLKYKGMLTIPYLDKDGRPLTVRFRCMADHDHRGLGHGKYMTLPEDPPRLFNVGAVHRADDEIAVTEGEFDAIIWEMVGVPAIAVPGASQWRPYYRRILAGFSRVWASGDPDEAGAKLNAQMVKAMRQTKIVPFTNGDVNETYLREGPNALLALIGRSS